MEQEWSRGRFVASSPSRVPRGTATVHATASVELCAARAQLDPEMHIEQWDPSSKVSYDQALLNELVSMRFVEAHAHVALVGPVGVGKPFLAHALGHIACRRGFSVLVLRADRMLKTLRHARLDNSYETELAN